MTYARAVVVVTLYAGFIVLALRVRIGATPFGSRRLQVFIGYVIFLSLTAGFTGRDLWPFAAWRYAVYRIEESGQLLVPVFVDDENRETAVDDRAFEPLEGPNMGGLLSDSLERLPKEESRARLNALLAIARANLSRAHQAGEVGTFSRILGPLAAPVFPATAEPWSDPHTRPKDLSGLRIYRVHWRVVDGIARIEKRERVVDSNP